jgi:two-component system, LytTR family, response regulator
MLTAIAVDDEPKALEVLALHAARLPFLDLKATFRDEMTAIAWLQNNPVDLIFLDINMPNLSGLSFRPLIGGQTMIVFTTAYSEYAVESYEQDAVDYLVKPIRFERFTKAVVRAARRKGLLPDSISSPTPSPDDSPASRQVIFVKSGLSLVRLPVEDILYLQKDGNYVYFHTAGGNRVMARLTAAQALDLLPGARFFQVHKSYIVALDRVREAAPHRVWIGQAEIPVAKERWKELMERLGMG